MGRLATGRQRRVTAGIGCVVVVTAALGIWIGRGGGTGGRTVGVLATVAVGSGASNVAVDARTGRAFVVDPVDGILSVLDARRGLLVATVPVAATPQLVVADDRRGHVFVTAPGELDMLDARTGHVRRRQMLPSVARAVALDRRRGRLILAMIGPVRGTVAVYDTGNGKLLALYAAAGSLTDVTVDDTTGRAYVTSDTQATPAAFTVIDISTGRTASLPTGARDLRAVAVAPSLHRAYVLAGRPGSATGQLDIVDTRPLGGNCCARCLSPAYHRSSRLTRSAGTSWWRMAPMAPCASTIRAVPCCTLSRALLLVRRWLLTREQDMCWQQTLTAPELPSSAL